jgi:hypothetical protein
LAQREIEMLRNQPIGNNIYEPSVFIMSPREIISELPITECLFKGIFQTLKAVWHRGR